MKKFFILFAAGLWVACAPVKLLEPTQADADRGAKAYQGYSLAELQQGKSIYVAHCNKCHRYKAPETRSEEKWHEVIPKMAKKAKLDSTQESLVLKYVVTMRTAKTN